MTITDRLRRIGFSLGRCHRWFGGGSEKEVEQGFSLSERLTKIIQRKMISLDKKAYSVFYHSKAWVPELYQGGMKRNRDYLVRLGLNDRNISFKIISK